MLVMPSNGWERDRSLVCGNMVIDELDAMLYG